MDKREAIIITAARMIHEKGYHHVGLKSILDELSIPKGSFYHYFKSKEALGLAIIDIYLQDTSDCMTTVSKDLEGLRTFFDVFFNRLKAMELKRGCPVGNLILELADENELFREKLSSWYQLVYQWIAEILESENINHSEEKAKALFAAFEGAMMVAKLDKRQEHFDIFHKFIFDGVIKST